jgi:hypothetical protein
MRVPWGSDKPALPLGPGVDLDAIAVSLSNADRLPDLRTSEAQQIWAALALLCALPPRLPFIADWPLPLPPGVVLPDHPYPDKYWQPWSIGGGPEGLYVELPWIEGDRLVRGRVLVPRNGLGVRILPGAVTIARGIRWQIPSWAEDAGGNPIPMRILGRMGEE